MEGRMNPPPNGGNAKVLAGVIPIVKNTIHPVIEKLYNDKNIQPYLRSDSEPSVPAIASQPSGSIQSTQDSQGYSQEYSEEESQESEIQKLLNQLEEIPKFEDLKKGANILIFP